MIKFNGVVLCYYDKNGTEINEGDVIRLADGKEKKVYRTEDGGLGTDATNPAWIAIGRAVPCEFGLYPLEDIDTDTCEIIRSEI